MRPDRVTCAELARLCEGTYPYEACGVWFADGEVRALPNRLQGTLARVAFEMDEVALLRVLTSGRAIAAFFHSHCDAGPELSPEDQSRLSPGGTALHPGVGQIVVSVEGGQARRICGFSFTRATWRLDFSVNSAEWLQHR